MAVALFVFGPPLLVAGRSGRRAGIPTSPAAAAPPSSAGAVSEGCLACWAWPRSWETSSARSPSPTSATGLGREPRRPSRESSSLMMATGARNVPCSTRSADRRRGSFRTRSGRAALRVVAVAVAVAVDDDGGGGDGGYGYGASTPCTRRNVNGAAVVLLIRSGNPRRSP